MSSAKNVNEFQKLFGHKLNDRRLPMGLMISHLDLQTEPFVIFETGTARMRDNWTGDGQSTLIWDWYASQNSLVKKVTSIDISPAAVRIASTQCPKVNFICGDSVTALNGIEDAEICKLLYLDSFDLDVNDPWPSSLHHMKELTSVWARLPVGCLVVVDDRVSNEIGKHIVVESFMKQLGKKPFFMGCQIAWMK